MDTPVANKNLSPNPMPQSPYSPSSTVCDYDQAAAFLPKSPAGLTTYDELKSTTLNDEKSKSAFHRRTPTRVPHSRREDLADVCFLVLERLFHAAADHIPM